MSKVALCCDDEPVCLFILSIKTKNVLTIILQAQFFNSYDN